MPPKKELLPGAPRLTGFSAKDFVKPLREKLLRPDGKPYLVYGETPFPGFVTSLRTLRDHVATMTTFANDLKRNLDRHGVTLGAHDGRLDRAEADIALLKSEERPFPIA